MATITKVSAQKRADRYNIFLDDRYAFSASEQTVAEFVLLPGKTLTDQEIEKIKQFDGRSRASDLAAKYLSCQPRSVYEVSAYLRKHGLDQTSIAGAIAALTDLGYLDDAKYARLFIADALQIGNKGPGQVKQQLRQKGLAEDVIETALQAVESDKWLLVSQRILRPLAGQAGRVSQQQLELKAKTRLLSHGFNGDLLVQAMENWQPPVDNDSQTEALKKQGIAAYKRFRRFAEPVRRQKMYQFLRRRGFSNAESNAFLDGEIISLAELEEY
ncbi:MAG: RecX family transcriptional regulator [Lactobacillus sp.]|nr:RecX family transcriptional regulator [Lactobacillus sp.]